MESKNLQQRLLYVRSKIPALKKQNHSDEVNYDFTKIDDIYRFMTPALNEAGVNMDIKSELPTRVDSNGNPVYVTKNPEQAGWLYEADLTLVWVNTDEPEDREEVTLHAIGMNDQPDKAKGSAWTYCLKYYFFTKFAIDQSGSEDPDMHAMGTQKRPAATKPEEKRAEERSKESRRPAAQNNPKPASQKQEAASQKASPQKADAGMGLEAARKVVCNFGVNRGQTLGQIADDAERGYKNIDWFANRYAGRDEEIRKAARIILQHMQDDGSEAA